MIETLHHFWYYNIVEPWIIGDFMARAVGISTLVAVACAVIGCWLYVRRLSMMGDALSHIVVPGIAIGFIVTGGRDGLAMLIGAALAGVVASVAISWISQRTKVKEDASIGIVYTAAFAVGVILINAFARNVHLDPDCVLFGNVLGVDSDSIWIMGAVTGGVLAASVLFYKPLLVSSFDPAYAAAIGLPVALIHYALMGVLSVTAVASFEAVGAVLVVALLIAPAATAHLLTDRMPTMLVLSVAHALISSLCGIYIAIIFDTNPAGAMVLVGAGLYALAFLMGPRHGILGRSLRRRRRRSADPAQRGDAGSSAVGGPIGVGT